MSFAVFCLFFLGSCEFLVPAAENEYRPEGKQAAGTIYTFGIHPYKNALAMHLAYDPIMKYLMQNMPGVIFRVEASNNYAHYEEKLFSRAFHFSLPNPYQTVVSLRHGYRVIARMSPDEDFRGIIVARKDKNLKSIDDLKGSTISFPAPTALAATLMPLRFLRDNGIDVKNDISMVFVGSQESSILNAYTGNSTAGGTWPPPWREWSKKNPAMAEEMEIVWQTGPLINNGVVVRNDIDETTARKVAEILSSLKTTPEGKAILENAGFGGFKTATDKTYRPVVVFLRDYDRIIGLPREMSGL